MELVFNIVFSVILMPVNLFCCFWIFRETLNLSGVTFQQIQKDLADKLPSVTSGSRYAQRSRANRRTRIMLAYLSEKSSDPQKTKKLFYYYLFSTLPGFAALMLAEYTAISQNSDKVKIAFIGNSILLLVNFALMIAGKVYRKNNPLDGKTAEMIKRVRARERGKSGRKIKNTIVYMLIGGVFLTILIGFNLTIAGIVGLPKQTKNQPGESIAQIAVPDSERVRAVLAARDFEIAEIPVSYWFIEEQDLMYVTAGIKGAAKFEFYDYNGGGAASGVFNQIVDRISSGLESTERNRNTAELPGGKLFVMSENGVYRLVIYKSDTVIYAYFPEGSGEIEDILMELGYIKMNTN